MVECGNMGQPGRGNGHGGNGHGGNESAPRILVVEDEALICVETADTL